MRERTDQSSREPRRTSCRVRACLSLSRVFFPSLFVPLEFPSSLFFSLFTFFSRRLSRTLRLRLVSPPARSLPLSREALFLRLILVSFCCLLRYLAWFLFSLPSPVIPPLCSPRLPFVRPAAWSKSLHLSLCFHPRASSLLRLSPAAYPRLGHVQHRRLLALSRRLTHTYASVSPPPPPVVAEEHRAHSSPLYNRALSVAATRARARAHTEPREYSSITCCCQTPQQRTVALNRRSPAREV